MLIHWILILNDKRVTYAQVMSIELHKNALTLYRYIVNAFLSLCLEIRVLWDYLL